ncbi:MAG: 30S ribosomal protein S19e [Candidatus Diapherotrites archaeon]|nr:30S ribosomal protein S19e [Candidatus Diapherotrites archaeon]
MATVYDVPPAKLIEKVSAKLQGFNELKPPEWAKFVKTSPHSTRAPEKEDWWFTRAASILRKIYISGPIGTSSLKSVYGGKTNRGAKPEKKGKASGNAIRKIMQGFESVGFVENKTGRIITAKGKSFLDKIATEIKKESEAAEAKK